MQRDEIRLEVLKLAHRHDRSPGEIVALAKSYETFVVGDVPLAAAPDKPKGPGTLRLNANADNSRKGAG